MKKLALTGHGRFQILIPMDRLALETELRVIRVALAAEFNIDPFSQCTRALRLMDVIAESQLEDAGAFMMASGVAITSFINPLVTMNRNDRPTYSQVVAALTTARHLDPAEWAIGLAEAGELHRFLVQGQLEGQPDLILGYVVGVGSYSPTPGGTYHSSTPPSPAPTLVQAVESQLLNDTGLVDPNSPVSINNNVISDGEMEFIMMNGTESDVTDSENGSPPWDLGNWAHHENQVMDFPGPAWDRVPVAEGFQQQPMAE